MPYATRIVVLPRFRVVVTDAAGPVEAHAHLQAAAAVVLAPPTRRYRIAGAEQSADPDHIILVNPMVEHQALSSGGAVLGVLMAPDFVVERTSGKRGISAGRPFAVARAPLTATVRGHAERLAALIGDSASPDGAIADATSAFARAVLDTYSSPAGPGGPAFDYRIRKAIQIATADPKRPAELETMLAASELSRSRFFQLFRECTGLTPQMFIDAHAVEAAIDALAHSRLPIARIARDLGHGTPERFARYIKRMTGLGPRDFRRAALRLR